MTSRIKVTPTPPRYNKRGKLINRDVARRYLVTEEDRQISAQRFGEFGYSLNENEDEGMTSNQKRKRAEWKLNRFMQRGGTQEDLKKFVEDAWDNGNSELMRAILKFANRLPSKQQVVETITHTLRT